MIFNHIQSTSIFGLSKNLLKGLAFIKNCDFTSMKTGKYYIESDLIYADLARTRTSPVALCKAEKHKKYIDIHYVIKGEERINFVQEILAHGTEIKDTGIPDVIFYDNIQNESSLILLPGFYAIIFPDEIHRTRCMVDQEKELEKVVIKVAADF